MFYGPSQTARSAPATGPSRRGRSYGSAPVRFRAALATLLLLAALAGCRDTADGSPDGRAAGPADTTAAVSIVDHRGREVRLPHPARRIVGLMPSANEVIVALGGADRIVARTDYDTDPALRGLPTVGGGLTPSLEWLASIRPDLVIAWPDARSRSLVGRLSELDVAVYTAPVQTVEQAFRTVRDLGVLLGRRQAADSLVAAIRAQFDSVRSATRGLEAPRVLYLIGLEPVMAAGPGTFVDELLAVAGGANALAGIGIQWPQLSVEEAVRRAPDVIMVAQAPGGTPVERLRETPGWRDLAAVREGRVHSLDPALFNRPGPRMGEASARLAAILHPASGS